MYDKLVIIFLLIVIAFLIVYLNRKIKKAYFKGQDELFKLILASGFDAKVKQFILYNEYVIPNQIVFVGDSITQDYHVYEFFKDFRVYNRGIGGDTTEGLLTRIKQSIIDLKPKVVVLLIGTNDIAILKSTPEYICENIKKIVEIIHKELPDTRIVLQSIYPISREVNSKIDLNSVNIRDNETIDKINFLLQSIEGVLFVDVNSHLKDDHGNLKLDYTVEGLHISPMGYKVITNLLEPIIKNCINK